MRKITAPFLMTVLALAVPAALAQQAAGTPLYGYVSITGIHANVGGDNPFRFFEYRDLDSGASAGLNVRGDSDSWYWNLFGENLGRDDQFAQLKGGRYGVFKFAVYSDDIVHNLTFRAITPFTGVGTNTLTFASAAPSTDTATWTPFDYSIQHRNVGGFAEARAGIDSPLYFRVTANEKRSDGIKPLGAPGTSPGGPTYELPAPVDWKTTDFSGEVGYATKAMHLSANVAYSKFEDHNDFLRWRNPIVATGANVEASTLATDTDMWRLGVNAMFKNLPMGSSLAMRGTYTRYEASTPILPTFLAVSGTTGANRLSGASHPVFEGEIVNKSLSASLYSSPYRALDTRLYYNWYERKNESEHLVFTPSGPGSGGTCDIAPAGTTATTCTPEHLDFTRNNAGLEVQYRVNRANKLSFDLDYVDLKRERIDFNRSKETKATLGWKNGSYEIVDVRVKYQHLARRSNFELGASANIFDKYLYRFDAAPLDRDLLKLVLDSSPAENLDLGAEVILKRNKYKDTVLGRTKDTRQELYLTASYGAPAAWRVTAFADYEHTQYESNHWVGATTTFPNPNAAGTTYQWQADVKDKNYLVGVGGDWIFNDRLRFKGAAIWQKTDGAVDFTTPNNFGNPIDIGAYDSFKKSTLNLKGIYAFTREVEVTLGAAYEKYDFSDVQIDGYIHAIRTGTTQNFLSGAYAFPSYKATVVYATLTYRFR